MKSRLLLVTFACFVTFAPLAPADDGLHQLLTRARISSGGNVSHIDGAVYAVGNQPVCAFGVVKLPDGDPEYTYFVLFKMLPKDFGELVVNGPLESATNTFDYKVVLNVGERKFPIAHKFKYDRREKLVVTDDFRIADRDPKAGDGRAYLVDLLADPPKLEPLKTMPRIVLDPQEENDVDSVRKVMAALYEDNAGLKERVSPQPKEK